MSNFTNEKVNAKVLQLEPIPAPRVNKDATDGALWYDSSAKSFKGIINGAIGSIGGGGGVNFGPGAFSPYSYGVKGGAVILQQCSWTSGSKNISCLNANFTQADVGKISFGTTGGQNGGQISGALHVPLGTITSVIDSTHVVVSIAATTTYNTNLGMFAYYSQNDGAAMNTAWHAAADACGTLILGADVYPINRGQFNYTNPRCIGNVGGDRKGQSVTGVGYMNGSVLLITPDFDFTTGAGNSCDGAGGGCFLDSIDGLNASNLTFYGASLNLSNAVIKLVRLAPAQNGNFHDLNFMAFQAGESNTTGVTLSCAWCSFDSFDIDGWGGNGLIVAGGGIPINPVQLSNSWIGDVSRWSLLVQTGLFRSVNNVYSYSAGVGSAIQGSSIFESVNDSFQSASACTAGFGVLQVSGTSRSFITNAHFESECPNGDIINGYNTAKVYIRNSIINGTGTNNGLVVGATNNFYLDAETLSQFTTTTKASITPGGLIHHPEFGTCTFAASTTCTVTFAVPFGAAPAFIITPVNPGAVTFTVTALSSTGATITASSSNSLSVGWNATL